MCHTASFGEFNVPVGGGNRRGGAYMYGKI